MIYSIKQVADKTHLPEHVLRYYEKEGLIPSVQRSEGGIRRYTDSDLEGLSLICCLKDTGMSIRQIKEFVTLSQQGGETLKRRCELLVLHEKNVRDHIRETEEHLCMVKYKLKIFSDLYETYKETQREMSADLERVFTDQLARYPFFMPQDAVKLLYQNEFGGGHIVANPTYSLSCLMREYEEIDQCACLPLYEDIGNGLCRLNLGAFRPGELSLETINNIFVLSAKEVNGSAASFNAKLNILRELTEQDIFAFSIRDLNDYLVIYEKEGCPMVSHSSTYRNAYHPAYRVVRKKYACCTEIYKKIDRLLQQKERIAIAIDGCCGSGKTTLADLVANIYDCSLIHMDDFFLPPELRTKERLEETGGNVHYERFLEEAAANIQSDAGFDYRVFDCSTMDYSGKRHVAPKRITVVEGAYSLHPLFADIYDLKIFTACSAQEQRRRILKRNGEELYRRFAQAWIPMENRYFEAFGIRDSCDAIIDTGQTDFAG